MERPVDVCIREKERLVKVPQLLYNYYRTLPGTVRPESDHVIRNRCGQTHAPYIS